MGHSNFLPEDTEIGNYNSARIYAAFKIGKLLVELDEYRKIAKFGVSDIIDEFISTDIAKIEGRIKGFTWYLETLMMVIDNSLLGIRKVGDKEKLVGWKKELKELKFQIPRCIFNIKIENRNGRMTLKKINENLFAEIFEKAEDLYIPITDILNKYNLIFIYVEDFDPVAYKNQILEDFATKG